MKQIAILIGICAITAPVFATTPRYTPASPTSATIYTSPTYYLSSGATADQINAQIVAASNAGGGSVILNNGTYTVDKPIVMKSKVRLKGQSKTGVVIRRGWSPTSETGIIYGSGSAQDVTISDLTIDGLSYRTYLLHGIFVNGATWERFRITQVTVQNCASGVHVKGTNHFILENSNISGNGGSTSGSMMYWHNVYLRRVATARVSYCTLSNSPSGCGIQGTETSNFTVNNCTASSNYWRGIRSAGPESITVLIKNNTVQNNGNYGIGTNTESGAPSYVCIIDNTITGNDNYGVNTDSGTNYGQVQGNSCSSNSPDNYNVGGSNLWYP